MGVRRDGRVAAMQILYALETAGSLENSEQAPEQAIEQHFFYFEEKVDPEVESFASKLCLGVVEHLTEIDQLIQKQSENWRLERMGAIDRAILRLATYELRFANDAPKKVVISEALDLAKAYGDIQSRSFINGLLDKM